LLGRDVVDIKRLKQKYLKGQTVLITGAGGTIGSELCRQAAAHGAARLVMVDVVENGLYAIEQELIFKFGEGKTALCAEVASIRDEERLDRLFLQYKPHLVYHAAAHKHVPLMETAPEEAVKNNIFGTLNVARCAEKHGAKRFVLISTDKAVNPTNVYGATKRVCEMIVQAMHGGNTEFVSVRFGNVLGSNGSVIPLFKAQIAAGGPLRVMHKEIIRYFMTVSEAVSLVMSAGEMSKGGEIFVLDMGDPVKILELAEMLIRLSGLEPYKDIDIEITGLRPGEKLYEELLMAEEGLQTTSNNKIFVGRPIDIESAKLFEAIDELKKAAKSGKRGELKDKLHELVPGFVV
jgi:FlaA1/EpsC-like NDP-sugar epimerase